MPVRKSIRKILAEFTLLSAELLTVWVLFVLSLAGFAILWKNVIYDNQTAFDLTFYRYLEIFRGEWSDQFMQSMTFMGNSEFVIPLALLLVGVFLFVIKHRWYSVKIPVVAGGSLTLNLILKWVFSRPRPVLPHMVEVVGYSFPSGHAMVSFSFYGLLIYLTWHNVLHPYLRWGIIIILTFIIFMIGVSRVYLGVHYASDVFAGFCVGMIWLTCSIWVLRKLEKVTKKEVGEEVA